MESGVKALFLFINFFNKQVFVSFPVFFCFFFVCSLFHVASKKKMYNFDSLVLESIFL